MIKNIKSKYQLELKSDNPFSDELLNEENYELIDNFKKIVDKRTKNFDYKIYTEGEDKNILIDILEIGYGRKDKKTGLYGNYLFVIVRYISTLFYTQFPNDVDIGIVVKMLKGEISKTYISKGKNGGVLLKIMSNRNKNEGYSEIKYRRDIIMQNYNQDIDNKTKKLINKIRSGIHIEENERHLIFKSYKEPLTYKLSQEGINIIESSELPDTIKEGFKEIEIKIESEFNNNLLIAIMSVVYCKEDLFLCFNPILNKMIIADENKIPISGKNFYLNINFSEIIKNLLGVEKTKELKKSSNGKIIESKIKKDYAIYDLFKHLLEKIIKIAPDNFKLKIEGKFDLNKFKEVEDLLHYDDVYINKKNGVKQGGKFIIEEDLKKYIKKINV